MTPPTEPTPHNPTPGPTRVDPAVRACPAVPQARSHPVRRAGRAHRDDGVIVASLALMAVVTWQLGLAALIDVPTALIAAASAGLLVRCRVNIAWLLAGGALLGLAASLFPASVSAQPTTVASPRPVVVFAAASLREVVSDVADEWSRRQAHPVTLSFDATSTLARQITEGAPADVFVAAAPEWLDQINPTVKADWLSNRLVCVVPREIEAFDLRTAQSLVLANEQVPAGSYARAALDHLGIPLPKRVVYGANVRDVLSKVVNRAAHAGIVYATDAAIEPAVRVAFVFPIDSHPRIVYAVGVLTPHGQRFAEALREPWALDIARRRGFIDLP